MMSLFTIQASFFVGTASMIVVMCQTNVAILVKNNCPHAIFKPYTAKFVTSFKGMYKMATLIPHVLAILVALGYQGLLTREGL